MIEARTGDVDSSIDKFSLRQPQAIVLHALRNPFSVGAVAAASPRLVSDVVSQVDSQCNVVVELGAGTGVITEALLQARNYRRGVTSIEIDQQLAGIARARLGQGAEVIVGDALDLASYFGTEQVDSIVCSLPLTLFSSQDLDSLLTAVRSVLKPGGSFVFYLYRMGFLSPRYQRVMQQMARYFCSVNENKTTWRNLPPARVIVCR